ncbi:uroporphyrinogen decarboxylase [Bradymonas sediminis]|uniref:Uroporphyrinogen decarboxylase n=1 Tax=Bradymonas sediminis TaxID=1548548 RepID=A0A2Z4FKP2_9DELT|nr:uroporphyrinogen decarboxylase [Bradymonas sediminis]AWV89567.1 uroporphyrinogen decarboxylase [Bradymonas sediminis]TDP76699.1 uroporphyrinogen decarboxylase [Bradymonas sediminis]
MNSRERFLKACRCEPVDRPPIWVMRQAGRHLPEYREFRKKHTFHEVVKAPELALEVTMQPIRRYKMDAAIIFSDILVIPEAMGQQYGFPEGGGIEMDFAVRTQADVDRLSVDGIESRLSYMSESLRLVKKELNGERALIGFSGSPWTLATYMVEGKSSKTYTHAKKMFYEDRVLFDRLMRKITQAVVRYVRLQIAAGVDAIQLFDSWGGVLAPDAFTQASAFWMKRVVDSVAGQVPVIIFSKDMSHLGDILATTGANVLGVNWNRRLSTVKNSLPSGIAVQGNLDPTVLNTNPEVVEREALRILKDMRGLPGHIFNLGHGIQPDASPENVAKLVDTVTNFK